MLLAKGTAARFVDKGGDSDEVVKLIEQLQEAIAHYQVSNHMVVASSIADMEQQISQQQAIYDRITDLTVSSFRLVPTVVATINPFIKSSFSTLLKLHEVEQYGKFTTALADG